jgi:hypothetical protein
MKEKRIKQQLTFMYNGWDINELSKQEQQEEFQRLLGMLKKNKTKPNKAEKELAKSYKSAKENGYIYESIIGKVEKYCSKCGQSKKGIKVSEFGWNICLCDIKTKMFDNIKEPINKIPEGLDFSSFKERTSSKQISELKELATLGIGHVHTIDIMDAKNRKEMTERLQRMYRLLIIIEIDNTN